MSANISTAIANRAMEWGSGLLEFVPGLRLSCVDIQSWIILVPALLPVSHVQLQVAVRHISSSLARALTPLTFVS